MDLVRKGGMGIGGRVALACVGLFVVLILIGGNLYRTDCRSAAGTVARSWTFTWDVPFVFSPSATGCDVHVGTRIALNAIGIDTFGSSGSELAGDKAARAAGVDAYWPRVKSTLVELQNGPVADTLTGNIAGLAVARDALVKLSPTAPYRGTHHRLVATLTALLIEGQQLDQALLRGDRSAQASIAVAAWARINEINADVTALNQIHAASRPS
jgi:hypothetical protein